MADGTQAARDQIGRELRSQLHGAIIYAISGEYESACAQIAECLRLCEGDTGLTVLLCAASQLAVARELKALRRTADFWVGEYRGASST